MSMANKDKCFIITPIGDDTDPIRRHIEGIIDEIAKSDPDRARYFCCRCIYL